jgi:gamma-glutamyl-gamma-aminobutyrate hydrolase PuuD
MKRRPRIGINCKLVSDGGDTYYKLDRNYAFSVLDAGGTPVLMPFFRTRAEARAFLETLDGVVFTGGPDIDPRRWRARKHPKADLMHPDRERSDFAAIPEALAADRPALFICCGHQELNVALGGSLHQHVGELPDVDRHAGGTTHDVSMTGDSRTREILGKPHLRVNSWHHQACDRVPRALRITSVSPDGLVEGLESPAHRFAIAVQWHPERMRDDARQRRLFRALVAEAAR